MATKTICDICKRDITEANRNSGADYKGFQFSVEPLPTDVCPAQTPDVCRHCIIDAFMASDDRPKEAEIADKLPWKVYSRGCADVLIAAFEREIDAGEYTALLAAKGGKNYAIKRSI